MDYPRSVHVVEVAPRDGLQNEKEIVPVEVKVAFIDALVDAGLKTVECGSFVSPKWVPQMADTALVLSRLRRVPGIAFPVLVPNLKGLEAAIDAGTKEIAVFAAASETFSQGNINCSISESLNRLHPVIECALHQDMRVRAYVSCVLGCPYEGEIALSAVSHVATELHNMGCYEVSLGDTIGVGTPLKAQKMIEAVTRDVPISRLAVHFHDTWGQALANILASLQMGIAVVDSAVAGLGGCPYAAGATGNVATEDVIYMLNGMGIETGVDLQKLAAAGRTISTHLHRPVASKAGVALQSSRHN